MAVAEVTREPVTGTAAPPSTAVLHVWVTTVDHKKIGLMYRVRSPQCARTTAFLLAA